MNNLKTFEDEMRHIVHMNKQSHFSDKMRWYLRGVRLLCRALSTLGEHTIVNLFKEL